MRLNADLSQRVVIDTNAVRWVSSPANGVDRRMLDRIGDEVAVATTIVRYLPQTGFHSHTHGAGEEILVLQGSYAAGTWLRYPRGSSTAFVAGPAGAQVFITTGHIGATFVT